MTMGWIKLHRSIINWDWFSNDKTFRLYIYILLKANVEDASWLGVKVKRGQFVTSRGHLADALGLSVQEIRTALRHLEKTGDISVKTTRFYTLITVENYDLYQGFEQFEPTDTDQ